MIEGIRVREILMGEKILRAVLLIFMAAAAYQDWKEKQINAGIFLVAAFCGIALQAGVQNENVWSILTGVGVGLVLLLFAWITGGSVGAGDGMMIMICGIYLGFWKNISLFMTALVMAGSAALFVIVVRKKGRNYRLPFVPFVLAAYLFQLL